MQEIIKKVEENYDLSISSIDKIKNVYKLNTDKGMKCLKVSKYDLLQYEFIVDCISYLTKSNFKGVVPLVKTKTESDFIDLSFGYAFITDWIPAREVDFKKPLELKLAINALSEMHLISKNFRDKEIVPIRRVYENWIKRFSKKYYELLKFKNLIEEKDKKSDFDEIYLNILEKHCIQAFDTIEALKTQDYFKLMKDLREKACICHHDTANHNFLITKSREIFIIDFDYCIYDIHLHDLASIIIRNLRYGNWNKNKMNYIVEIYSETIPISKLEEKLIFSFMKFPQDFWQVGLQYYIEKQPWKEEVFMKRLNRVVTDSEERFSFLEEVLQAH